MVDVHDVVADLDGVQLFQRHGKFAGTRAVALERVLVETVENLVVGEDAHPCLMVDKTLVERAGDGREGDVVAAVFEDGPQAGNLLLGVAENQYLIAILQEFGEGGGDEVEVFVVDALWRAVEVGRGAGAAAAQRVVLVHVRGSER